MPKEDPFVNRAELLKAIKKYPEIWDSNNKLHMCRSVTAPMWNEIAEQFGGHVPTVKLQSIWSQMKYHYHNLVHRQILHKERFTTKWEHFEPMSFMHSITVAKIVGTGASISAGSAGSAGSTSSVELNLMQSQAPLLPQSQGRGRPSGSFTWLPPLTVQSDVNADSAPFSAFTGLVPPAAITVETITTPLRKPGRPGSLNNSMRGRIIEAIKARPLLWSGRQKTDQKGHNRTSAIWKEVAAELCLTPSLVQTRWSIIKQRYVDELQKERHARYAQESFHSNWEHFERMSFMRDILVKKVDEREQTREQIQEIVNEKQQMQNIHQQQHHHHHHHQQQQEQQQQNSHNQILHNYDAQHLRYIRNSLGNGTPETHMLPPPLPPPHHLVSVDAHNRALHSHHLHQLNALSMCNENTSTNTNNDNNNSKINNNTGSSGSSSSSNSRSITSTAGGTSNSRNNNNNDHNTNGEHNHLTVHNQSLSGNGIVGAGSIMSLMPHPTVVSYTGGTRSTNNRRAKHVNDLEWDSFEMMLHVQNAADAAAAVNAAAAAVNN